MDEDAMFDQLDTDGDGKIDEAELGAALKSMGVPIEVGQLFQMLDVNQDGVIDREEFHGFYEMFSGGGGDDDGELEDDAADPNDSGVAAAAGAGSSGSGGGRSGGGNREHDDARQNEAILDEIMDDLADAETGAVAADEIAGLATNYFGVNRNTFVQLLQSNGYTVNSSLQRSEVQGLVTQCKSLERLDEDIDLDDSDDDGEPLGEGFGEEGEDGEARDAGNRMADFLDNAGSDEGGAAPVDDARVVFDEIDIDNDGNVTFDEMFTALVEMGVDYTSAQKFAGNMVGTQSPDQTISFEAFKRVFATLVSNDDDPDNVAAGTDGDDGGGDGDDDDDGDDDRAGATTPVALQDALEASAKFGTASFGHRRTLSNGSAGSRGSAGSAGGMPREDTDLKGEALEEESRQLDQRLERVQEANRVARKREAELQAEIDGRKTSLAKLQAREDTLKEEVAALQIQDEQLRTKVSRLHGRADSSKQRESELAVIRTDINESVARIQKAIKKQSSETAAHAESDPDPYGKHAELLEHISAMKAEHSDMTSQLEKLQKEFDANNELIQELLQQSKADDEHMDSLRTQVHDLQSGGVGDNAAALADDDDDASHSATSSRRSSGNLGYGDFSNLALDLSAHGAAGGVGAAGVRQGPPTPDAAAGEESLGSIIAPDGDGGDDDDEPSTFGNLSLQLDISNGMVHGSSDDDEEEDGAESGMSLGMLEGDSLAVCESVIELPAAEVEHQSGEFMTTAGDDDGHTSGGGSAAATAVATTTTATSTSSSSSTADELGKGGLTERDWEDARAVTYTKFVENAIGVLQKIKAGNLPRTPAPAKFRGAEDKFGEEATSRALSGTVQTYADKLFNQAVGLEHDLLEHAKRGSFRRMYANKPLESVKHTGMRQGGFAGGGPQALIKRAAAASGAPGHRPGGTGPRRRNTNPAQGGAISLLLREAVKLSNVSGVVHETQLNRGDAKADGPVPEGSFRCEECYFINANLRLQCKQCMHLRFAPFDKRHLAVVQVTLKNTPGVLKTPGVLPKKYQFKVHGNARMTYINLKTKKQKSIKYADIAAVTLDKRTLRLTFKPAARPAVEDALAGGGGGKGGNEVVYKAVSEKTASTIYNCIKQRLDRAAAVAALEKQERVRAENQQEWVSHLNKCCDDVFDDVVGSSAGKSVVEAEAALVKAGRAKDAGSVIAGVRQQFRTAATRKLIKKFDRMYPSLSAVLAGTADTAGPTSPGFRF